MTTQDFNAKRREIEDSYNRMAGLVVTIVCAMSTLAAIAFTLALMSPK